MKFYSPRAATALIIANMAGVGVFVTLGYQLEDIKTGFPILLLWILGGIAALCGALCYAELGSALPRSGGEYNFLRRIFHPAAGFISGWVSVTVGFAAPIAAVALAFGAYLQDVVPWLGEQHEKALAIGVILFATLFHISGRKQSSLFQSLFTWLKVILIFVFCVAALIFAQSWQPLAVMPVEGDMAQIMSGDFASALVYVVFAYTGWNAATYIIDELENPQQDLKKILLTGTAIVTLLYVLLNFVFLKMAPVEAMANERQIAIIASKHAFGASGGFIVGIVLSFLMISTVGAMILAGPRALQAIGEDYRLFRFLGKIESNGLPVRAILLQTVIAMVFVMLSNLKDIMNLAGAILAFNSFLAIAGLIVLRFKEPDLKRSYKVPFYPLTPILYLTITGTMLVFVVQKYKYAAPFGAGLIIAGLILYCLSVYVEKSNSSD